MWLQSPDNMEGPRGYVQLQSNGMLPDLVDTNQERLHPALTHTVLTHQVRRAEMHLFSCTSGLFTWI
jgi:hypothetical protein